MGKKSKDESEEFKKCIYCTERKKGRCRLPSCVYPPERAVEIITKKMQIAKAI